MLYADLGKSSAEKIQKGRTRVYSIDFDVEKECKSFKEGVSKLVDKIFYHVKNNEKKGYEFQCTMSMEQLTERMHRHPDTIRRYLKSIREAGLFFIEKPRKKKDGKIRYKFTPTQKLLNIKKCGTQIDDDDINDILNSNYANRHDAENPTPESRTDIESADPFLNKEIIIKVLNNTLTRNKTISLKGQEEIPPEYEKNQRSVLPLTPGEAALILFEDFMNKLPEPLKNKFKGDLNEKPFISTMNKLFQWKFKTVDDFKEFLDGILANAFVLGEKPMKSGDRFNLSIGTILSPSFIEDFINKKGYFDVWPPKEETPLRFSATRNRNPWGNFNALSEEPDGTFSEEEIDEEIEKLYEPEKCKEIRRKIFRKIGKDEYRSWFHKASFKELPNGKIQMTPENNWARKIWDEKYDFWEGFCK